MKPAPLLALLAAPLAAATVARAGEVHYHFQPPDYVRQVCGDEQHWGCIYWTVATDNPRDRDCLHLSATGGRIQFSAWRRSGYLP